MPTARQELSTAVLDGKVYVIAGYDVNGASTGTVEVYNPTTNTWARRSRIPIVNNHNNAAVAAGKLYSFGGLANQTFVYDPGSNSWSEVAPMQFRAWRHRGRRGAQRQDLCRRRHGRHATRAGGLRSGREHLDESRAHECARGITPAARLSMASFTLSADAVQPRRRLRSKCTTQPRTRGRVARRCRPAAPGIGVAAVNGELFVFGGEIPTAARRGGSLQPADEHLAHAAEYAESTPRHLGVCHRQCGPSARRRKCARFWREQHQRCFRPGCAGHAACRNARPARRRIPSQLFHRRGREIQLAAQQPASPWTTGATSPLLRETAPPLCCRIQRPASAPKFYRVLAQRP